MTGVSNSELKLRIKAESEKLGFCLCGFTGVDSPEDYVRYEEWLQKEQYGSMGFLAREDHRAKRNDPRLLFPEARSACVLAVPYKLFPKEGDLEIASFAHYKDYHDEITRLAKQLMETAAPAVSYRICVDSAPILERSLAVRAGLGWIGKSSMFISRRFGSAVMLCVILIDAEIEPDPPFSEDLCGICRRCAEACPAGCIDPVSRTINASQCISYLTIEHKDEFTEQQARVIGYRIFGCDECLRACPWNRNNIPDSPLSLAERLPDESDLGISDAEFKAGFAGTCFERLKNKRLQRNLNSALKSRKE